MARQDEMKCEGIAGRELCHKLWHEVDREVVRERLLVDGGPWYAVVSSGVLRVFTPKEAEARSCVGFWQNSNLYQVVSN